MTDFTPTQIVFIAWFMMRGKQVVLGHESAHPARSKRRCFVTYPRSNRQRTKEIGIRKVFGASVSQVVAMLSKDFVKLVLLANLIAWPVAYLAMNTWLDNFAYHIDVGLWTFALAGASALLIAALTVSYQAIKAATANPVDSLRYE